MHVALCIFDVHFIFHFHLTWFSCNKILYIYKFMLRAKNAILFSTGNLLDAILKSIYTITENL